MKIAILSYLATYGNAPGLAAGLADLGHEVKLILRYRNAAGRGDYGFADEWPTLRVDEKATDLAAAAAWVYAADKLVVMAMPSLSWLLRKIVDSPFWPDGLSAAAVAADKGGAIVLSSSHLFRGCPWDHAASRESGFTPAEFNNRLIEASGLQPFVMPDLAAYVRPTNGRRARPYYHPTGAEAPRTGPSTDMLIRLGHSPGKSSKRAWKGTRTIERTFRHLRRRHRRRDGAGLTWRVLEGLTHDESIAAKREMDIFVDQVHPGTAVRGWPRYTGGLGKSGLEAMGAGCCVITSGPTGPCEPDFPEPPVIQIGGDEDLGLRLAELLEKPKRMREVGETGRAWIDQYMRPEKVAARIVEGMT